MSRGHFLFSENRDIVYFRQEEHTGVSVSVDLGREVGFQVFVAAAGNGDHHHVVGAELHLGERSDGVGRFERGDDAFEAGQFERSLECFLVADGNDLCTVLGCQVEDLLEYDYAEVMEE